MRMKTVLACVAGFALAVPAMAQAQGRQGTWETSLGVAFQNSANADFKGGTKVDFPSDQGFLLAFDYNWTDNLAIGATFGIGSRDYTAKVAGQNAGQFYDIKGSLDYTSLFVDATWNFMDGPFTPFVTGGLGWTWWDTNIATSPPQTGCWWDPWFGYICTTWQDSKTIDGFSYSLGIGARYDFSDHFAVKGSYVMDWVDFSTASGTPSFDGFDLSVTWKF